MNIYLKNTQPRSTECKYIVIRNGINAAQAFCAKHPRWERVPATEALHQQARSNVIPTYLVDPFSGSIACRL